MYWWVAPNTHLYLPFSPPLPPLWVFVWWTKSSLFLLQIQRVVCLWTRTFRKDARYFSSFKIKSVNISRVNFKVYGSEKLHIKKHISNYFWIASEIMDQFKTDCWCSNVTIGATKVFCSGDFCLWLYCCPISFFCSIMIFLFWEFIKNNSLDYNVVCCLEQVNMEKFISYFWTLPIAILYPV